MAEDLMVEDPVCGKELDPECAAASVRYNGEEWFFCSEACRDLFQKSPRLYVENAAEEENIEMTLT